MPAVTGVPLAFDPLVNAIFCALQQSDAPTDEKLNALRRASQLADLYSGELSSPQGFKAFVAKTMG
jgi:hypothetical protein